MNLTILSLVTHSDHWLHPFIPNAGMNPPTTLKRIAGIALFIILGRVTWGVSVVFIVATAIWKHYKNDQKNRISPAQDVASIDNIIQRVLKLSTDLPKEGKKLCLFIGRQNHEELPQLEGEVWVSLDECEGNEVNPNRLHLKIDFRRDWILLVRIKKCFDKIVVDQSTMKFFINDPWRSLGRLLRDNAESTLITEASPGAYYFLDDQNFVRYFNDPPITSVSIPMRKFASTPQNQREALKATYAQKNLERNEKYLKTLFSEFVHITDQPYPYKTNFNNASGKDNYYILKGPKMAQINAMYIPSKESNEPLVAIKVENNSCN
jgi:hypothetical protein